MPHRVVGDVGEVDEHPLAVQLPDDLLSEARQASVRVVPRGGVRPRRVVVVGEREIAGREAREDAQDAERATDRMPSLDADHGGDPPGHRDPFDVVGGARDLEDVGMRGDQPPECVDLLERLRHRGVAREIRRHVDGPELPADASLCETGKIRLELRTRRRNVGGRLARDPLLAKLPEQVVVPVDQRRGAEELRPARGRLHPQSIRLAA